MTYHEKPQAKAINQERDRSEPGIDRKGAELIAENLRALNDLRGFHQFIAAGADWESLEQSDPETCQNYRAISRAFLDEAKRNPKPGRSSIQMIEIAIRNLDRHVTKTETDPRIINYRNYEQKVRALMDFFATGGDWEGVRAADPGRFEELRDTYRAVDRSCKTEPEYRGMDFRQTAAALIERFGDKALALAEDRAERLRPKEMSLAPEPRKVIQPHDLYTKAELSLPNEVSEEWQIIKVDKTRRTYAVCRASDRRSPGDILGDIAAGRKYRGAMAGYVLSWEEFELYNQANVDARGGSRRAEIA